jgi:hypothetical protein
MEIAPGEKPAANGGWADAIGGNDVMRFVAVICGVGALALAGLAYSAAPADAAKSKMGCERGKEKWNAASGKCESAKAAKPAPKKAAAKKK